VIIYSAGFYVLGANRHSFTRCEAEDNIYGFFLQKCNRCSVRDCRSDNNAEFATSTGEGFTDVGFVAVPVGTLGTPASPGVSTSVFEFNHAYMNGNGATHVGANGNYNVFVDPATATVPLPTLQGTISTSTYAFLNPALNTPVHNISMIQ
jgi:hypothetical protein